MAAFGDVSQAWLCKARIVVIATSTPLHASKSGGLLKNRGRDRMSERGCSSRRMEAKFSFYDIFASLELIPIGDDDQAAARHEELYQREVRDDGTFVHAVCPSCVTIGFHMTGCVLNFWGHDISKDSITTYHHRLTTVTAATTCHLLLGFSNNPIAWYALGTSTMVQALTSPMEKLSGTRTSQVMKARSFWDDEKVVIPPVLEQDGA